MDIYGSFWSIISDDIEMDRAVFDNLEMDLRTFSSLKEIVWKLDIDIYVLLIKMKGTNIETVENFNGLGGMLNVLFESLILMHVIKFLNFTIIYQLAITTYNFSVCTLIIKWFFCILSLYTLSFINILMKTFLQKNSTINNI